MRGGESRVLNRVQSINRGMTMAEFYGIDEVFTVEESIPAVLDKYEDVFDWYTYQQKEEMEKLVDEMLSSGVMRSSTSPYSSPVLLVKKNKNLEEHLQHLEMVLEVLRENELYANKKKCSFVKTRVEYLGHIISWQGVEVDLEKIRAITE
ncbi:ty3-gypsy retroelement transposase [Cucumis melo var. makuwa]|uniref:Ty3-gypsy retroelement transposase n=1 Tax=Cucumis melo var. makuwa TaxID=1194695 RepID=A0A5D3BSQ9_CUCMM|nr:ty3-gypsy retroelement transposase [Cucumis melo var. makuwa]TYK01256.1 ty3-gypsy retroelement transposase [Cucumis melo var. makuwa]